jgi:hypothetical protein
VKGQSNLAIAGFSRNVFKYYAAKVSFRYSNKLNKRVLKLIEFNLTSNYNLILVVDSLWAIRFKDERVTTQIVY